MISIALAGFIVWLILSLAERNRDNGLDGWMCFVLCIVPSVLGILIGWSISFFELPPALLLLPFILYVIVPALLLRFGPELTWGRSIAYGFIVLLALISAEVLVGIGFAAVSS